MLSLPNTHVPCSSNKAIPNWPRTHTSRALKDIIKSGTTEELSGVVIIWLSLWHQTDSALFFEPFLMQSWLSSTLLTPRAFAKKSVRHKLRPTSLVLALISLFQTTALQKLFLRDLSDYHEGKPGLMSLDFVYIDDANTRILNYKRTMLVPVFLVSYSAVPKWWVYFKETVNYTLHPRSL